MSEKYFESATIDDACMLKLDATKITTDIWDADRIGVNTLDADKLNVTTPSSITAEMVFNPRKFRPPKS